MCLLSYISIGRKTTASVTVLVEGTAPRASARSSLRVRRAACGNSLQVPTITIQHHGETKTVIKKLPDDSRKTVACSMEQCGSWATLRTSVSSAEKSTSKGDELFQFARPIGISGVPRNYFRRGGSTNLVEDRGQRERGSRGR
jgi:hypothetical protein